MVGAPLGEKWTQRWRSIESRSGRDVARTQLSLLQVRSCVPVQVGARNRPDEAQQRLFVS